MALLWLLFFFGFRFAHLAALFVMLSNPMDRGIRTSTAFTVRPPRMPSASGMSHSSLTFFWLFLAHVLAWPCCASSKQLLRALSCQASLRWAWLWLA